MIQFWWWELRLVELLKKWSQWNYLLVVSYAVVLFLRVAILVPRRWDDVLDLNDYFLSKRRWFYSALLLAFALDVLDSYMKGGWAYHFGERADELRPADRDHSVAIIGFRSSRIRVHSVMSIFFFAWMLIIAFDVFPYLQG